MAQCRCFGADITINRGEDRTVRFIVSDRDGKPVDLSGSAFSVNVYAVPGAEQGAPALAASLDEGGAVALKFSHGDKWPADSYRYELFRVEGDEPFDVRTLLAAGKISVRGGRYAC